MDSTLLSIKPDLICVCVCVRVRPSGSGGALQGRPASGAAPGSPEDLREEASTQQTSHVSQDPNEDHRPAQHQR